MKIGSALAKFESTSSFTAIAKSFSAGGRMVVRVGTSQSCDRSVGRRGWFVGFRTTLVVEGCCWASGVATGVSNAASSTHEKGMYFVCTSRFYISKL